MALCGDLSASRRGIKTRGQVGLFGLLFLQLFGDTLGRLALLEQLRPVLAFGFLGGLDRAPGSFVQIERGVNVGSGLLAPSRNVPTVQS